MNSIKKNVFWSSILTTANYLFPIITFPYVSRVLGVENVGICNFVDSVINYFCIFSMMGVGYIGIREVAKNRTDKQRLTEVFSSLFALNITSTIIVTLILILSTFLVPQFSKHAHLMYIGVFKLIFNTLLIEWLYKGLEDFEYITIRTLVVRIAYVISVFIFVREANDYTIYYVLLTLTIVINALINTIYARKHTGFSIKAVHVKQFVKPFFILGIYVFLTSLYKTFNTVYLGFIGGETQVGYYSTATKLHSIILALFAAFTGVMMPRMAALVAEGKKDEFNILYQKSIKILYAFSIPLVCLSVIFADQIIRWVSGQGYEGAIPCMQIVMPLVFVIGYEQILVFQILMPLRKDKCIFINSFVGACVGLTLNLLLVPIVFGIGSACVWLASEFSILILAQYFVKKYTKMGFPFLLTGKYILVSLPIVIALIVLHRINPLGDYTVLIAVAITLLYYAIIEIYIMKNEVVLSSIKQFNKIIINKL